MHRVELKVILWNLFVEISEFVPNAPCGVERTQGHQKQP